MKFEFINLSRTKTPQTFLRGHLQIWLKRLPKLKGTLKARDLKTLRTSHTLRIVFVGPSQMKKLNKQFRRKNYVTDILSFTSDEPGVLGELIVCPQKVTAQAQELGVHARDEALFLVLHGILHLLGYDHEKDAKQAEKMFTIQKKFFSVLRSNAKGLNHGAFDRVI